MKMAMVDRSCPICASNDRARLVAEANVQLDELDAFAFSSRKAPEYMHWRLWECGRCDALFGNPVPRMQDLARLYGAAAFSSSTEARFASRTYGRILAKFASRLPDKQGALDIGTGDGAFLHELVDQGFSDVVGVEPSAAPIEAADSRVRPLIRRGLFQAGMFAESTLSLVTCFQTIEHVPDALGLCKEAHRILKPGGALFLIGHNCRAFSARILGRKSPIFDLEHLQLFSPESFKNLFEAAGFTRVEILTVHNVYPISYWGQLLPFPRKLKPAMLAMLNAVGIGKIPIRLPAGNLAAIGYR